MKGWAGPAALVFDESISAIRILCDPQGAILHHRFTHVIPARAWIQKRLLTSFVIPDFMGLT
jgi:hypothetical protein